MSSQYFNQLLVKVSGKAEKEAIQNNREAKLTFDGVLFYAVEAWCQELDFSDETTGFIKKILDDCKAWIDDIWSIWSEKIGFFKEDSNFKKIIINNLSNRINREINDVNFTILIAFVITAVGYLLYQLNQKSIKETSPSRDIQYPYIQSPPSQTNKETTGILVLVINAGKEDILQNLKSNRPVTTNDAESLYTATKALWMGTQREFDQFKIWFTNDSQVRENEQSEYDVYFVKIDINKLDRGFSPNVNQLDRLDAFRKLPENARQVVVSPRLSSKAYENKYFYNR